MSTNPHEEKNDALVFVVDDDRGLVRLIERSLGREGFRTASANTSREAEARLESQRPDLLLLDLKLDDGGGPELIDRLTKSGHLPPFIIITGQGDERVAVEMMKRGALDYLIKDARFIEAVPAIVRRTLRQAERDRRLVAAEEALKQEHALIAGILDTAGALVIVLDPLGRIVRFNRAAMEVTGYPLEEVQGRNFHALLIAPEEISFVKQVFDQLCESGRRIDHDNHLVTRNGAHRLLTWSDRALTDRNGKVQYVIKTGIDITERKRLEKEILEVSDREQRRIGQDLHDGLCQHLAGIELMSEVLRQRLEPRAPADAARLGEIARLVRDAIGQTRLLARGLSPVTLDSEGLMSALAELAANTGKMFGVPCRFDCPHPVPVQDHTVATHLFRIAQEAVSNAIKHGKATQITIRLQQQGERDVLMIHDNGNGLPVEKRKPSGMGLRIMQYRSGMIGGSLAVQHNPEGGTSVVCSIQTAPANPSLRPSS